MPATDKCLAPQSPENQRLQLALIAARLRIKELEARLSDYEAKVRDCVAILEEQRADLVAARETLQAFAIQQRKLTCASLF